MLEREKIKQAVNKYALNVTYGAGTIGGIMFSCAFFRQDYDQDRLEIYKAEAAFYEPGVIPAETLKKIEETSGDVEKMQNAMILGVSLMVGAAGYECINLAKKADEWITNR